MLARSLESILTQPFLEFSQGLIGGSLKNLLEGVIGHNDSERVAQAGQKATHFFSWCCSMYSGHHPKKAVRRRPCIKLPDNGGKHIARHIEAIFLPENSDSKMRIVIQGLDSDS
jgi:hypothetical protein